MCQLILGLFVVVGMEWPAAGDIWSSIRVALGEASPPVISDETRSIFERLDELKPVAVASTDSPLRKLLKERFNARLGVVKIQLAIVRAGSGPRLDLTIHLDRLALNGADLEDKPAERVKWLQLRLDAWREQERMAKAQAHNGRIFEMDALQLTAARADAEIDLLLLTDMLKEKK